MFGSKGYHINFICKLSSHQGRLLLKLLYLLGRKKHEFICVAYIGWLFVYHLHIELWMLKGAHDIFVMVINFIHNDWEVKHITILFEVIDTSGIAMATKLQELLDWFALIDKIVTYVNDERFNLQTCASALNSIVSCSILVLLEPFRGSCLGMHFQRCVNMPL